MPDQILNELASLTPRRTDIIPLARANGDLSKATINQVMDAIFDKNANNEYAYLNAQNISDARRERIEAFYKSPLIVAPLRANNQAYSASANNENAGATVRLANGDHLIASVSGTSAGTEPAGYVMGRPIVDGTVTWYEVPYKGVANDPLAPTVTPITFAQFAANGLVSVNLGNSSGPVTLVSSEEAIINSLGTNYIFGVNFATGTSAWGGGATGNVTGGNAAGWPVTLEKTHGYNTSSDGTYNMIITDRKFALGCHNFGSRLEVHVDGRLVEGAMSNYTAGGGNGLLYDFGSDHRPRLVQVGIGAQLRNVAITPQGKIEAAPKTGDVALVLSDSHFSTTSPDVRNIWACGYYFKRLLGFSGLINAASGGSGYVTKQTNQFNLNEVLNNNDNVAMWQYLKPNHIFVHHGNNDNSVAAITRRAAMSQAWTRIRTLFPTAKITIFNGLNGGANSTAQTWTMGADIIAEFNAWITATGETNAKLITSNGTDANTGFITGTGNSSSALTTLGLATIVIGTDTVHQSPAGSFVVASMYANAVINAWKGQY